MGLSLCIRSVATDGPSNAHLTAVWWWWCVCVGGMTWFAPGFVPRPQLANNCHHMAPDAIRILLRQLQDECKENLAAVA